MEHWIRHIWSTGYVTYEALGRPHMEHGVRHIWSTGYVTYGALNILHMKHRKGLILQICFLFCTFRRFATKFGGALGKF